jgi:Mn2+/Fe2+ NRAMP family transporter
MARFRRFCAPAQSPWLWLMGATVVAAVVNEWAKGLWALLVFAATPVGWLLIFTDLPVVLFRRDETRGKPQ